MFSAKFNVFYENKKLEKTINNFIKHIKTTFVGNSKIVKNGNSTEISTGKVAIIDGSYIELVIRKRIPINEDIFNDKCKLDKVIMETKDFCDSAKKIECYEYKDLIRRIEYENKT